MQMDPEMTKEKNDLQRSLFLQHKRLQGQLLGAHEVAFPNTHFVLHLHENIKDFGSPRLDCEVEEASGLPLPAGSDLGTLTELPCQACLQRPKFYITHSNRHAPLVDLMLADEQCQALRHLLQGGSYPNGLKAGEGFSGWPGISLTRTIYAAATGALAASMGSLVCQ